MPAGGRGQLAHKHYSIPCLLKPLLHFCVTFCYKRLFLPLHQKQPAYFIFSLLKCAPRTLLYKRSKIAASSLLSMGGVVTSKKSEPEVWFVCHSKSSLHRLISVRVKLNLCHNAKSNKTLTRTTPQIAISLVLHLILSIAALAGWHEMYLYGQVLQQDCCKRPTSPGVFRKSAAISG